jgi:site-specific recombinase XerD
MALEAVQAQAGHASIESTRIYLHLADDWLAAQYRKAAEVIDAQVFAGQVTTATLAHRLGTLRMFFVRLDEWGWDEAPPRVPMFPGDLPRQGHPLPKALDDASAAKLLRAAQHDKRLLVRVTVEMLLRTGLRVSEYTSLRADAVVHIGAGPWLHVPVARHRAGASKTSDHALPASGPAHAAFGELAARRLSMYERCRA